jgi:glucan phosphoethanolaminetransferase (alkaline phosphatase superfamily)
MGNQQVLRIVLSLAILVAFFLPVSSAGSSGINLQVSAWEVLSQSVRNIGELGNLPSEFYVLIGCFFVMLVAALVLLLVSILRRTLAPVLTFIPFLVMVVLLIFTFTQSPVTASETVQTFGSGFYVMLIASFLLLFTNINEKDLQDNQPTNRKTNHQSQQHEIKTS